MYAGQEGCRKGGMKGLRDEGMQGRSDEKKEGFRTGCMKGGIQN